MVSIHKILPRHKPLYLKELLDRDLKLLQPLAVSSGITGLAILSARYQPELPLGMSEVPDAFDHVMLQCMGRFDEFPRQGDWVNDQVFRSNLHFFATERLSQYRDRGGRDFTARVGLTD